MRLWSLRVGLAALLALSSLALVGCRTGAPAAQTGQTDRVDSATTPAEAPCRFG